MNKIVKITKAKYPTYWYAEFVGETREVAVSDDFPHLYVSKEDCGLSGSECYLLKDDCEEVKNE